MPIPSERAQSGPASLGLDSHAMEFASFSLVCMAGDTGGPELGTELLSSSRAAGAEPCLQPPGHIP